MRFGVIKGLKRYKISEKGDVYSLDYNKTGQMRELKQNKNKDGHKRLELAGKCYFVHRLVAQAFIPNPDSKPCVCHKNGDPSDNRVENLYWGTNKENMTDRETHGNTPRGERCGMSKLNKFQVQRIRLMKEISPGLSQQRIADIFGVNQTLVGFIIRKVIWKHV